MKNFFVNLYKKIIFNLSSNNSFIFIRYYRNFYKPKPNTISFELDKYSKKLKDEFYVIQIGANDGIDNDLIHKFIKRDNWRGVLLEPQKYVFEKYLSKIYKKNNGINVINSAIGYSDGEITLYKIGFCNERWATGLASFKKESLEKAFLNGYIKKRAKKSKIQIPEEKEKHIIEEKVNVICPNTLIKNFGIQKIDLLQIDAEGFDYDVIKMFDISKNKPNLIIFENTHFSKTEFNECINLLQNNNYEIKSYGGNSIAISDNFKNNMNFSV